MSTEEKVSVENTDIIISINIYKCPETLQLQLNSIAQHVQCNHRIVLNCNDYMNVKCKQMSLPSHIHINPDIINKQYWTGQITQGILSNMQYAINKFQFKHFIVISGRTIFYENLTTDILDGYKKSWKSIEEWQHDVTTEKFRWEWPYGWHWPDIRHTKLSKYYEKKGYCLYSCPHEGLCFTSQVVKNIINFFDNHADIGKDLFNCKGCLEEFALQTIAYNEVNIYNMEYGYNYIGRESECFRTNDKKPFTHKITFICDNK